MLVYLVLFAVLGAAFDLADLLRRARRGPWRAEVAEDSMVPALRPGDWLLLDPTARRWPRPGSIVVIREPDTGILAIKRVAERGRRSPGDSAAAETPAEPRQDVSRGLGPGRRLAPREAWLLGDSTDGSIDSRTYGALDADDLVARAWFRYGPLRRIGRLR
jgi:signal peptidase I